MGKETELVVGIYEALITNRLNTKLAELEEGEIYVASRPLQSDEAVLRISSFVSELVRETLTHLPEKDRLVEGERIVKDLIKNLAENNKLIDTDLDVLKSPLKVLEAVLAEPIDNDQAQGFQPSTRLIDTFLLTNSPGEQRVGTQIVSEISSADSIDVLMAFIKTSGIYPYLRKFKSHCQSGKPLRIITTTYTGATDVEALQQLQEIGAQIKVSYDTTHTRLHAKAWLFSRLTGFSTAYVGSSNLSRPAMSDGLEWNVRVSNSQNPEVIERIGTVFESYWQNPDFEDFNVDEFIERSPQNLGEFAPVLKFPDITLKPFQKRMLEQIQAAREAGHSRNLLVSATGTGKTIMSAVDFSRQRARLGGPKLLFIAHREEILKQAQNEFQRVLKDPNFGELWVGGKRPTKSENVFASVQSLNAFGIEKISPNHFDFVIVDEFHHAAAKSYQKILEHLKPKELLGLTATPERTDGLDILKYFDGRIAAELRLWDAIDQRYLSPFAYFGIHDEVDLQHIPWKRGIGYDNEALSNVYTGNDAWAALVIKQMKEIVGSIDNMCGLGYCVSISHANFMAKVFNKAGIPAAVIVGETDSKLRSSYLDQLASGKLRIIFSVDVLNEGVDIQGVDTLLMLRPTESATLFLQQLGRGLRKKDGKEFCTVLDFIGIHRTEFRFDLKYRALLGGTRKGLEKQIKSGFPFLPAGSSMDLDPIAQERILKSLETSIPSKWPTLVKELKAIGDVPLATFLEESGLDIEDIYSTRSWTELRQDAGFLEVAAEDPSRKSLLRAVGRLLHIDDRIRIDNYRAIINNDASVQSSFDTDYRKKFVRMLAASLNTLKTDTKPEHGIALVQKFPEICEEINQLLDLLELRVDRLSKYGSIRSVPLATHASYTRLEILSAMSIGGVGKPPLWQEGVWWDASNETDLLLITLDKSGEKFSDSTRFHDYAISQELIHWQSQARTSVNSETGQRYVNQVSGETNVAIFVRLSDSQRDFMYLGLADYVQHQGDRPISITWKLREPLPGDVYSKFAVAVA